MFSSRHGQYASCNLAFQMAIKQTLDERKLAEREKLSFQMNLARTEFEDLDVGSIASLCAEYGGDRLSCVVEHEILD